MTTVLDEALVRTFVPPRRNDSRKGQNGRTLIVGGGTIYHGAPVLASLAALRTGSDLVYTAIPKHNVTPTRALCADLIVIPMADQKLTRGTAKKLLGATPNGIDSAAIGMGLTVAEKGALELVVSTLVNSDVRLLLDAGALCSNILELVSKKNCVLTPHAGEYARLFGIPPPEPIEERICAVSDAALKHSVTILLKGHTDIITDGKTTYLCKKDAPAMTVGGTGDVLSGIIASLLGRNRNSLESAAAGAFINASAGLCCQKRLGLHMIASDLIDEIPHTMIPFDKTV